MHPLEEVATLFDYPDEDYPDRVAACARHVGSEDMRRFAAEICALPLSRQQELFVQTFDLDPKATLEIGWHIFGEQYERGDFLVEMRDRLRETGIVENGELPDHLLHVLPLLARMPAAEAGSLAASRIAPALAKIESAIPADNPFSTLVRAARSLVAGVQVPAGGR